MSPLSNVWKFFGKLRKKHRRVQKQTLRQVSKIFKNLRKYSEILGKNRRMSHSAQNDLPAFFIIFFKFWEIIGSLQKSSDVFWNLRNISKIVAKCLKQPSSIFECFEIFRNCPKSSEIFEILRKKSEDVGKFSKRSSDNFCKVSKIFGNVRKCSKILRKPSENFRMWLEDYENFKNIPISYTCMWTEDRIQEFDL